MVIILSDVNALVDKNTLINLIRTKLDSYNMR
jgi:hypothetical protein